MVNVFMIDDHPVVLTGMTSALSDPQGRTRIVGSSLSMADALLQLPRFKVHVILLDLYLRDKPPNESFNLLRTKFPDIPVVIYTGEDSTYWKCIMFKLGVNAYLNKWASTETIIQTILQVSDGSVLLPPAVKNIISPDPMCPEDMPLTWEELEMGKEISFGKSIKDIARIFGKSVSSIEKILRTLRIKTGSHSNPDLTRTLLSRKLVPLSNETISKSDTDKMINN